MERLSDNLVRANYCGGAIRAADGDGNTLTGVATTWGTWYEVDSVYEGRFMERVMPGAYDAAVKRSMPKALYHHGQDPQIGMNPLGQVVEFRAADEGQVFAVALSATNYNRDIVRPLALDGLLGASYRFGVDAAGEKWDYTPKRSDGNPNALPERTITSFARVPEFGPTPFPANTETYTGMRAATDEWLERLLADPAFVARFSERVGPNVMQKILARAADGPRTDSQTGSPDGQRDGTHGRPVAVANSIVEALRLATPK